MSRKKQGGLKSRDKIITKISKGGLVEQNRTTGEEQRISNRELDFDLCSDAVFEKLDTSNQKTTNFTSNQKDLSQLGTKRTNKSVKRKIMRIHQRQKLSRDNVQEKKNSTDITKSANVEEKSSHHLKQTFKESDNIKSWDTSSSINSQPNNKTSDVPRHGAKLNQHRKATIHHDSDELSKSQSRPIPKKKQSPMQQDKFITTYASQTSETVNDASLKLIKDELHPEKIMPSAPIGPSREVKSISDSKVAEPPSPKSKLTHQNESQKLNTKIVKLEDKVKKTSKKLDTAKNKLPTKRKLRLERTFDESQNKGKTRLKFDKDVKTQKEHLKGSLPMRPIKLIGNVAVANVHRKMYQVEDENVGTKAAHRTELLAEGVVRSALRHRKIAPYRKVAKLENKLTKRSIKLEYHKNLEKNPKLKNNPISRMLQKRKIKKRYAKAARETKKIAQKAKKAASLTGKASNAVLNLIKKNPKAFIMVIVVFIFINIISSIIGMLAGSGSGGIGAIVVSSYLSAEQEIEAVALAYSEWEMDLMMQTINTELMHQGYDEYRMNTGDISHNPFELMAYLTATNHDFTYLGVESQLRALFNEQYQLSFTPSVETKYYEQEIGDSGEVERVPYDWHIMTVTLTARNFTDIINSRMDAEQRQHYNLLMQTRGQRQIVGNPFSFGWFSFVTSDYGYRIHPISGERDLHRGIDIGVPLGTEISAGFDGVITFAGNNRGYGNIVVIKGADGLEAKYAHLDSIAVRNGQRVTIGDIIGTVGNTGNSTAPHLHLETLRNNEYLNPILFVDIGDFDFSSPSNPSAVPPNGTPRPPMSDDTWNGMIAEGEKHLGKPYVFGANGPNAYDCSSFVSTVLRDSGIRNVGRQTAQGLFNLSSPVAGTPQPGDLVFFHSTYSTNRLVTHIGIFAGYDTNNRPVMIHAGSPIQYTHIDTPYWTKHFLGYGRISD